MAAADYTCSIPGCEVHCYARGWCSRHYQRWRIHGDPLGGGRDRRPRGCSISDVVAHELSQATQDGDCIITSASTWHGYGITKFRGKVITIPRLIMTLQAGRTLSSDEHVCHKCNRRACINPEHLYIGTHAQNMRDISVAGTKSGDNSPLRKLSSSQVAYIRQQIADGCSNADLAREFKVDGSTISNIKRRKTWRYTA